MPGYFKTAARLLNEDSVVFNQY